MLDVYNNEIALRLKIYEVSSCYNPYETEYINLLTDLLSFYHLMKLRMKVIFSLNVVFMMN